MVRYVNRFFGDSSFQKNYLSINVNLLQGNVVTFDVTTNQTKVLADGNIQVNLMKSGFKFVLVQFS